MALKTVLESLDGIEESLHTLYVEKDGKFILQLEGVDDHPAVVALRNGHRNSKKERDDARTELADLKRKLEAVPEDFDADRWAQFVADEEARKDDPEGKDVRAQVDAATKAVRDQLQAKIDKMKADHEKALADKDAEISERDAEIRKRVATDGLKAALAAAHVNPGLIGGAVALFDRNVEVVQEDGEYVARMKSDLGGDTVDTYISNWAQSDEAKAWISPAKGADEQGNNTRRGNTSDNPFSKAGWSKTAQATLIQTNRKRAEELAKAAGFKNLEATYAARKPIEA